MSLKTIHIVFISASILLSIGFGAWNLNNYFSGLGSTFDLALGLGSVGATLALIFYGKYFLRKLKDVPYL